MGSEEKLTDSGERRKFLQRYTFNMKDKNGLVTPKTLKAEKRLVEMMIAMLALFCFLLGEIAMTAQFKAKFTTANISDIILIFVVIMKLFLIVLLFIVWKIKK